MTMTTLSNPNRLPSYMGGTPMGGSSESSGVFGGLGNLFSGLKEFLMGTPGKLESAQTLTPEQQAFLQRIMGQVDPSTFAIQNQPTYQAGQSYLQSLLGGDISQFQAPYMRQFQQQTSDLAERFAGLGGLSSSGFQQALGGAAAGLQENLAALRGGLQQQALGQALGYAQAPGMMNLNLANLGLRPTMQPYYVQGDQGLIKGLLPLASLIGAKKLNIF